MDNAQLDDLKQFITATVSQATANIVTKSDIKRLEVKIDDLDLKVDTISDNLNDRINDNDARLTKLEQHTA